jgi:HlyD family secretion protein
MANGNGKKKKRRMLYVGASIVGVLVIVFGVVAATRGGTKIDSSKLAKVDRGDLAKSVVATGKIEPITKVEIKSKASGIVKKWNLDAGQTVKAGQVLVELDKVEIEAQVRQARRRR